MSFLFPPPPPPPPPPPITTADGGGSSTTTIVITQPQYYNPPSETNNIDVMNDTSPSPSPSTSIIIVIIVIASAIIVSASIYLLLRCLSRYYRRTFRTFSSASAADDVVLQNRRMDDRRVADSSVFDSLPLFTFGSVTGRLTGGDCAVCLSKFERQDQLRLLPLCCHAFHARCIDTWLSSNLTCPLCRSAVNAADSEVLNKILSSSEDTRSSNINSSSGNNGTNRSGSFRVEIGSISRRRGASDTFGDGRRSYSIGSFDYIVDDGYEVPVGLTHQRGMSDCTSVDKESVGVPATGPPGESLAAEVSGSRSWLRDYVDRLNSFSFSSRTLSFRSSGRYMFGSSRRNDVVVPIADLEANQIGEEISEYFRWLSGV